MEESDPFCPPSRRIGDILVSLRPEEVRSVVLDAGDKVASPTAALATLRTVVSDFPMDRLEDIVLCHGNDQPKLGRDELLTFIFDDDGGKAAFAARTRARWVPRAATRSWLLGGVTSGEGEAAAVRCEVAFGLHIRPMLAITADRYDGRPLSLPWRCWFDLEPAIDAWAADGVARRTSDLRHYSPTTERGRDFLANGSCVAISQTVAHILEQRRRTTSLDLPFRFEVATSMESIGFAGHLLERRHQRSIDREATRLRTHLSRYQAACDVVLLDALLLLQPALPETAVVWGPPPPPPSPPSDEDYDYF